MIARSIEAIDPAYRTRIGSGAIAACSSESMTGDERTVDVDVAHGPSRTDSRLSIRDGDLDPICRTVMWPNEADLAREALRHSPA